MAAFTWTPSALTWLHVNNLIDGLHKQISWKNCLYAVNSYFTLCALDFEDTHVHVSNTHAKFDLCAFWYACEL